MKNMMIHGVMFVVGTLLGVAASREYYRSKYEKEYKDSVNSMKRVLAKTGNYAEEVEEDNIEGEDGSVTDPISTLDYGGFTPTTVDYRTFFKNKEDEDVMPSDEKEEELAESESPSEKSEPYIISEEDYSENHLEYAKTILTYYTKDDVVVDDVSREVVESSTVGYKNLEILAETDEECIYVRNDNLAIDAEITKTEMTVEEAGVAAYD